MSQIQNVAKDIYQQSSVIGDTGPRFMSNYNDSNSNSYDGFSLFPTSPQMTSSTSSGNKLMNKSTSSSTHGLASIQQAANGAKQLKPELILQELSDRYNRKGVEIHHSRSPKSCFTSYSMCWVSKLECPS